MCLLSHNIKSYIGINNEREGKKKKKKKKRRTNKEKLGEMAEEKKPAKEFNRRAKAADGMY